MVGASKERGFTLAEVLVALGILGLLLAGLLGAVSAGLFRLSWVETEEAILGLLQDQLEIVRALPPEALKEPGEFPIYDHSHRLMNHPRGEGRVKVEEYGEQSLDLRKVTASIEWREGSRNRHLSLSTVIWIGEKK
ncbi:MAG: hypothetical protein AMS15_09125 [Planctomycetes bacterium DG_23]|nr:MAG: hypothetical protein AMS15_09125 [Planctomycetes bacterium DG_23]